MLKLKILSVLSVGFFLLGIGHAFGKEEQSKLIDLGKGLAAQWGEHFGPVREKNTA